MYNSPKWQRIPLLSAVSFFLFLTTTCVFAQVSPEEHASHHPGQSQGSPQQSMPGDGSTTPPESGGMMGGGMEGGMGGMMEGMMEKMGAPKPKEMYPQLMDFPNLDDGQRAEIRQEAHQRMMTGTSLLSTGLDELSKAAPTDDFAAMQEATAKMREGLAQFESGLAAHRAIAEGKSPRNVALQWFKREMNLLPPSATASTGFTLIGMTLFHSLIMLMLVLFTVAMIWMYFFKMRRAAALLEKLTTEASPTGASPTGASAQPVLGSAIPPGAKATVENDASVATSSPSTPVAASENKGCCETADQPCSEECGNECGGETGVNEKPVFSEGLLPVARRKLCKLRVAKIYPETDGVKTFRLVACNGGPIPFSYLPGQFLTLKLPVGEKPIRRSYTIASSPTQGYHCEITVKREDKGVGSRYLHDSVTEGDTLEVQAPSGKFVFTGKEADDVVLIAGGVGITPMMSITRALSDMGWPGDINFIVACRDPKHFIFESELKQLQTRHPNIKVFAAMSQTGKANKRYASGRITKELLLEWVPDIASKRVHVCGPVPMMDAVKAMLLEIGTPTGNIHTENFGSQAKPRAKSAGKEKIAKEATEDKPLHLDLAHVEFKTSGKSTSIAADETVLEAAERNGVDIDNSCRVGSCGMCTIKLISGTVTMEVEDGLEPEDKAAGKILACQAKCAKDIVVDA